MVCACMLAHLLQEVIHHGVELGNGSLAMAGCAWHLLPQLVQRVLQALGYLCIGCTYHLPSKHNSVCLLLCFADSAKGAYRAL